MSFNMILGVQPILHGIVEGSHKYRERARHMNLISSQPINFSISSAKPMKVEHKNHSSLDIDTYKTVHHWLQLFLNGMYSSFSFYLRYRHLVYHGSGKPLQLKR
jgi:hypothetical protein